ncbi:WecB/TagA/CpsF family glycosyltransferase [Rhodohalobacter mucosus]|uniref:Glycosyltransferase n=1 Tax=Rhodohalobacter mucosus TaxID=2079485 RepID=A0A316TVT5_9BACT|nr:WecB/TagA/CpsF family glycosyltransferase [Rhodohalobacter mucosus]PWN07469.1 glycosyltransferase [Rhodohalobacter mucosus]
MSKSVQINGYRVYPFKNRKAFLSFLKNGHWENILVALNAEKIIREDEELRDLVNKNIGYPDGVGAVWALRRAGKEAIKIPGAEFWLDIIEAFHKEKTFYLVGGKPEVMEDTIQKLKKQFPDLNLAGYRNGYFNEEEYQILKEEIFQKKPDIVFVAMGSPKQEYIMQELQEQHKALYMGLGGSFDVYTGYVQRAPNSWINLNLEWAYRLLKQPSRIGRQRVLVKFLYKLLLGKL